MPREISGELRADGLKFGIVASRFNDFITGRLIEGCLDGLLRHGAAEGDITVVRVPGSFEIPLALAKMARAGGHDALIALGAVIKGGTPHNEYIASEVTKGIAQISLETGVPIAYGVITPDTLEQAIERAGSKMGNKGFDAALSAIEMANVLKKLGKKK
jgi:6,7-dimethyl-8-ribityllumazine synthase